MFDKANWNLFRAASDAALDSVDVQSGNINEVYGLFVKALLTAAKQAIPRTNGKRRNKPFCTPAVARIIRHSRVKTDKSRRQYNRLTALAKETIAGATRDKWNRACANLDIADGRKTWRLLNHLTGASEPKVAQPLRAANEEVVSDRKRSDALNRHFAAVSKSLEETPMSMALNGIRRQKERTNWPLE